jgi:cobalt-zinc-cadmium efflux system outer membrane protein
MPTSLVLRTAAWVAGVMLCLGEVRAQAQEPLVNLDLHTALSYAASNNRLLDAARARVREAEGGLVTANLLLQNNPELGFAVGPRVPSEPLLTRTTDLEIGIAQRFPITGQRGHRIGQAEALVLASKGSLGNTERLIGFAVATAFYSTLASEERVVIRQQAESLAEGLDEVAARRLELGEGTALEQDTARIRLAEAKRRVLVARAEHRTNQSILAELLGTAGDATLTLAGELPPARTPPSEDVLVARALDSRLDLLALRREVEAAEKGVELQKSLSWPDVALGFQYERDEGDDKYMAQLSLPLPSFNRNQGEVAIASAALERVQAEADALALAVEAEVRRALATYEQARQAVELYSAELLAAQEDTVALLVRAFEAGEVGTADVLLVQRELVEGREGYLEARLDLARAQAGLLAALNLPQTDFPEAE